MSGPSHPLRLMGQPEGEWTAETRAALDATVTTGRSRPLHLPSVIAHHPHHLPAYLAWAKSIALQPVLPPRAVALLALRSAWNSNSPFEWGVHVERVTIAGTLDAEEIERVGGSDLGEGWSADDSALLTAADELAATHTISADTWHELASRYDAAELVEIVLTVGHYTMLAMVANASGVRGEPEWAAFGHSETED